MRTLIPYHHITILPTVPGARPLLVWELVGLAPTGTVSGNEWVVNARPVSHFRYTIPFFTIYFIQSENLE